MTDVLRLRFLNNAVDQNLNFDTTIGTILIAHLQNSRLRRGV